MGSVRLIYNDVLLKLTRGSLGHSLCRQEKTAKPIVCLQILPKRWPLVAAMSGDRTKRD